jgi:hypothetical protein
MGFSGPLALDARVPREVWKERSIDFVSEAEYFTAQRRSGSPYFE